MRFILSLLSARVGTKYEICSISREHFSMPASRVVTVQTNEECTAC